MLNMSEAQALVAVSHFLAALAEAQPRSNLSGASCHGGITCFPYVIQYLFSKYEITPNMRESFEDPGNVKQKAY